MLQGLFLFGIWFSRCLCRCFRRHHLGFSWWHLGLDAAEDVVLVSRPSLVVPFEARQVAAAFLQFFFWIHRLIYSLERLDDGDALILNLDDHGLRFQHVNADKSSIIVANPIDSLGIVAVHVDMMDITILEK